MIKREVIDKHLEDLAVRVARLRTYQDCSFEEFSSHWEAIYAAERCIQTAIQNLLDIGAHLLAALGDSQWDEYREIPARERFYSSKDGRDTQHPCPSVCRG